MVVVNTIWDDFLYQQVAECRRRIRIASPGLHRSQVESILGAKRKGVALEMVTGFDIRTFYMGKTDLDAVEELVRHDHAIVGVPGLEAIFATFDEERAFLSSGNFVAEGPGSQKSYNVLIDNPFVSRQLSDDFSQLAKSEAAHPFSIPLIQSYREIIRQLQDKEQGAGKQHTAPPSKTELLDSLALKGWTMDVLDVVMKLRQTTFRLDDVYAYIPHLQQNYPLNNNVDAKIRQQLQVLRDLGLIDFLDQRGTYRKRWPLA
jgi:type II restriction enzyme